MNYITQKLHNNGIVENRDIKQKLQEVVDEFKVVYKQLGLEKMKVLWMS